MAHDRLTNFIWYEKHRPVDFKDLSLNKDHRVAFAAYVAAGEIPHLLLEGPQGSGKTTVAQILMSSIPCTVLALNASGQDRGVATIKGKVKDFAGSQAKQGKLKIVFFDEADGLSSDALFAMKNTIEAYSANCRFILTCNCVDKIIPPIQSRCTRYTFDRFPKRKMLGTCEAILEKEGIVDTPQEELIELISRYYPDMRSVVNNLQAACVSGSFNMKAIGALNIDPTVVGEAVKIGGLQSIRTHLAGVTDFTFLYRWLFDEFIANNGTADQKPEMALAVMRASARDMQVPDREINFVGCCIEVMLAMSVKPNFFK